MTSAPTSFAPSRCFAGKIGTLVAHPSLSGLENGADGSQQARQGFFSDTG